MRREKICGIYGVKNTLDGKIYVGKAKDIYARFSAHKTEAKLEVMTERGSPLLFKAMQKHGISNFELHILEILELDESLLKERELYWMDFYDSYNRCCGYNLRRDSSTNMIVHPETSEKMSNNLKQQWANGVRSTHGEKLSKNWETNEGRKELQSEVMSKALTKYTYNIYTITGEFIKNVLHKELCEMDLGNCLATFHQKKSNTINFKGFKIIRTTKLK